MQPRDGGILQVHAKGYFRRETTQGAKQRHLRCLRQLASNFRHWTFPKAAGYPIAARYSAEAIYALVSPCAGPTEAGFGKLLPNPAGTKCRYDSHGPQQRTLRTKLEPQAAYDRSALFGNPVAGPLGKQVLGAHARADKQRYHGRQIRGHSEADHGRLENLEAEHLVRTHGRKAVLAILKRFRRFQPI